MPSAFGLDRTGVLVYLQALNEARLESRMPEKSVLARDNLMGVAMAHEAGMRFLAADPGEKNIRLNAIAAGPKANC